MKFAGNFIAKCPCPTHVPFFSGKVADSDEAKGAMMEILSKCGNMGGVAVFPDMANEKC